MKAIRSNMEICTVGGILPVLKCIKDFGIASIIRSFLGKRPAQAKYGYEDSIIAWMLTNMQGGFRLDHISKMKKNCSLIDEKDLKLPSHDTLGRTFKSLATQIEHSEHLGGKWRDPKVITREINDNAILNRILIKTAKSVKMLKPGISYTLDMDVTLIHTDCRDTRTTYARARGYAPMVSFIGKTPVYIGMRNGNVAPAALALESLEKTFTLLEEQGINADKIRMDGAKYSFETYDFIHERGKRFYIPTKGNSAVIGALMQCNFKKEEEFKTSTHVWNIESGETTHKFKYGNYTYRLVAFRTKMDEKGRTPRGWTEDERGYAYKILLTNDFKSSIRDMMEFYNQRGAIEKNFDYLKNDFGWRLPPFSNMNENLVFFFIGAMTSVVYQGVLHSLKKKVKEIRLNMRLHDFIVVFVTVALSRNYDEYVFHEPEGGIAYVKLI
jgi:hypothetical protein